MKPMNGKEESGSSPAPQAAGGGCWWRFGLLLVFTYASALLAAFLDGVDSLLLLLGSSVAVLGLVYLAARVWGVVDAAKAQRRARGVGQGSDGALALRVREGPSGVAEPEPASGADDTGPSAAPEASEPWLSTAWGVLLAFVLSGASLLAILSGALGDARLLVAAGTSVGAYALLFVGARWIGRSVQRARARWARAAADGSGDVRLRARAGGSCPLCRVELGAEETARCPGCGTEYHVECMTEMGACSTLGCRAARAPQQRA